MSGAPWLPWPRRAGSGSGSNDAASAAAASAAVIGLAGSAPQLQEATDRRRAAIERAMDENLRRSFATLRHSVVETCEDLSTENISASRAILADRMQVQKGTLEQARHAHSLFLTEDGKVYSCGLGDYGQLGHGNQEDQDVPKLIEALPPVA